MTTTPDLFDLLAADDEREVLHMVLPDMATACGLDLLELLELLAAARITGNRLTTLTTTETTCPDCLAVGDLSALCRAMQRRQAPAAG
ncbi:hypothetical protein [Sanguibacter suaedae]|uniref:Uncharacterized protein n=1 Tax=Sanguibacter suaedae TaxID=2795737 RepID=A0A934M7D3_9MICO|nr:hypothetical protein [Sanguibacter suaedae]MBI9115272.1 hypothetical protein [Sanguibacter suaedae]